jgi:hypothetical protein
MGKAKLGLFVASAIAAAVCTSPAHAVATGDTLTCSATGGFNCSPASATLGAGSEFQISTGIGGLSADFSNNLLVIAAGQNAQPLSSLSLTFSDLTTAIGSFNFNSVTGFSGFDASHVSLNGGLLTLNFSGVEAGRNGGRISIALADSSVPEPSTWAMMLVGFGAIGFAMRRKQSRTVRYNVA